MLQSELTPLYLTFSQMYSRKLGVVAGMPDGCAATQWELNKPEDQELLKFNERLGEG